MRYMGGKENQTSGRKPICKKEDRKKWIDITTGNDEKGGISATDRDRILERALGIYKIPLDDRIRRLELTELGVVRFAKQILRDLRQGLWQEGVVGARHGVEYNGRGGKKIIPSVRSRTARSKEDFGFTCIDLKATSFEFGRMIPGSTRRRNSVRLA